MTRKISHSFINGSAGAGTGGQGLKIEWDSSNNGELYWLDVDESSLEAVAHYQGSNYGFTAGGFFSWGSFPTTIDRYSLSSDGNGTDVGDITNGATGVSMNSSETHGYACGGGPGGGHGGMYDTIDKFSFSTGGTATDIGNLIAAIQRCAGSSSTTYGYQAGGQDNSNNNVNTIQKISFSSDGNASDVGDLIGTRRFAAGQTSSTHGYMSAGYTSSNSNVIEKYSHSSDGDSTNVGDVTVAGHIPAGMSGGDYGYTLGGVERTTTIDKFAFASDGNATDVGDCTTISSSGGTNSTTHGYSAGGNSGGNTNMIEKFSFSSDGNTTDVGDLSESKNSIGSVGSQY